MWVVHLLIMSVRNVSFMLKECIEAKWNGGKLQAGCLGCSASWAPYWSVLGFEYQSWCMLTTLPWVFWQLQVIFPFENHYFGTQNWVPRLKHLKSQVFFLSEMCTDSVWLKWHLNSLSRNGWAMWSCCCGEDLLLMPVVVRMLSACWGMQRGCSSLEHKAALGWFVCSLF